MQTHKKHDIAAPRPTLAQRAKKVVARALLLSLAPFIINLFFQGKQEFRKEIDLAKKIHTIRKKG